MRVLITGASGFIGKNLTATLRLMENVTIYPFDIHNSRDELELYAKNCDFVFHLAGVNRPEKAEDFMSGNFDFTSLLLTLLEKNNNRCPILITSSAQAVLDNPYGKSKKAGEALLFDHAKRSGAKVLIYRLSNVFGKWCRPNYNSAVATFCHNIARGLPITLTDPSIVMNLVYIDDVVAEFINALDGRENTNGQFCSIPTVHTALLGEIADLLYSFEKSRGQLLVPDMSDDFTKKLYSTYLSYLPENSFSYPLTARTDSRGAFTEIIRTPDRGQFSVNISKPGIIKGNHWHHTKNEKFLVVSGKGVVRLRNINEDKIIEYRVNGKKQEVVDIPPGYTHNIENTGDVDMVTFMWANESFDPENPDTYYLEV